MQSLKTRNARRKGFTLTEIAIVLGIIGLILGAIWVAASAVYSNQRAEHANTEVLQIAQGVRSMYSTSSTTGVAANTDLTSALIKGGVIPNDIINAAGTGTNGPFSGGSTMVVAIGDGNGFGILMNDVPTANCIALLNAVGGSSHDPGLTMAEGAPNATPAVGDVPSTTGSPITTPVTPANAILAASGNIGGCTQAAGALNEVMFVFTLH